MRTLGYARDYGEASPEIGRLFDLSGRVAIVTGGGSGLGRAIALGLAQFGADLAVADRDVESAERTAEKARELGRQSASFSVDVTAWDDVRAMVDAAHERFGHLDICVSSAGGNIRRTTLEMTPEEWHFVIELNLTGTWYTAKAVGAYLVAQGRGKIINLASIFGHVANESNAAYTPSKGGVVQLTRALAIEWAPHNVQVNCLAPTYIRTPLTRPIQEDEARLEQLNRLSPIGRFGEPWELIGPAVFLASDASGLVTGHSLLVDGGWTAR